MKKYITAVLFLSVALCSCGKEDKNMNLVFPKTTWNMSQEEIMDAWELTESDIYDFGQNDVLITDGHELFGEPTTSINFQFYDYGNDGVYELSQVLVTYPNDADMEHVLKEMQKAYGAPDPNVTFYYPYSALEVLTPYEAKDPDSVKNWARESVATLIPAEETDDFRKAWEYYQYGLNEENWDKYIQDSRLVRISLLTDEGWNRVEFNASNLWIYETIKNELHASNSQP